MMKKTYLQAHEDLIEHGFFNHYRDNGWGGRALIWKRDWQEQHLPKEDGFKTHTEPLTICFVKTKDRSVKSVVNYYLAYEHANCSDLPEELSSLQAYFYGSHLCDCHRKTATWCQYPGQEDSCEGTRDNWMIESIVLANMKGPGLILYSETMTLEELEASLQE